MRTFRLLLPLLVLGLPVATVTFSAEPVSADPFSYRSLASDFRSACAISTDDTMVCWGSNPNGHLIGRTTPSDYVSTPTRVPAPSGETWSEIDPGGTTTCATTNSGRAYCWGERGLGNYFTTSSRTPVRVEFPNDRRVHGIKVGAYTSCAIENGVDVLWCWGDAHYIGDGNIDPVRIPVRVDMPDNGSIRHLDNSGSTVCAITSLGAMYCWGGNDDGQLGLGYAQSRSYGYSWTPVLVPAPSGTTWTSVSVGLNRICGIASDGKGYCAGDNYAGSFGNGTYDDSNRFVAMQVPDGEGVAMVSTTWYHTCIVTVGGRTWCAGNGDNGQLGTGTTLGGRTWRAPLLPDGARVRTLALQNPASCFLLEDGTIQCSGFTNTPITYPVPSAILRPSQLTAVGPPTVSAVTVRDIDAESAVLGGTVASHGVVATAWIELATDPGFSDARRIPIGVPIGAGSLPVTWSVSPGDLAPRTTHHVRVVATNDLGTVTGPVASFTTLGTEPVVSAATFSDVTGNEATVRTTINPGRLRTTARVEYSVDAAFITGVVSVPLPESAGSADIEHQLVLTGLPPRTDLHVRVVAENRLGTVVSGANVLHTVGDEPTVTLQGLAQTARTVTAEVLVDPGLAAGTVTAELSSVPDFSTIVRTTGSSFTSREHRVHRFDFVGLAPRTSYYVRVTAVNPVGSTRVVRSLRTNGGAPTASIDDIVPSAHGAAVALRFDPNALDTLVTLRVSESADMSSPTEHFVFAGDSEGSVSTVLDIAGLDRRRDHWVTVTASNPAGIVTSDPVRFTTLMPIGVMIDNDNDETASTSVTLDLAWPAGTVAVRIANNPSFKWARVLSPASPIRWELAASTDAGDDPDLREVWVEFIARDGSRSIHRDAITLLDDPGADDADAPVVTLARSSRVASAAVIGSRSARSVRITVRDRRSGVNRIEVRSNGRVVRTKVEPLRSATYSIALPKSRGTTWVRVLDVAGHASKWIRIR